MEYLIYEDWKTAHLFQAQWDSRASKRLSVHCGRSGGGVPDLRFLLRRGIQRRGARRADRAEACWDASGALINCAGTGQDGEIQAGVPWPDAALYRQRRWHGDGQPDRADLAEGRRSFW